MKPFSLFNQNPGEILSNPNVVSGNSAAPSFVSSLGFADVPDISGMSYTEAIDTLLENGFDWLTLSIPTANEEDHNIIDSYTYDGLVYLNVYKYDPSLVVLATVPDLTGMTQSEAEAALTSAGFVASFSSSTAGATSGNNGKVKSQSPSSGEQYQVGSTVSVVKYNYVVAANTVNGNISGIRWAWQGDSSGNYAMFIRGRVFAGTIGSTVSISGTSTGMDGNHTVVSINDDNSFDTGGTRIMVTRDSAPTGVSSTVTGTWTLVS